VILVDTSAWVEFLRGTGSPGDLRLQAALREGEILASTDVVVMEVLGGARDGAELERLRRLLHSQEFLAAERLSDYELAADVYRRCRAGGETPRNFIDCLIAVVAIRNDAEVLSEDADFLAIARHTSLRLAA
jgi:predicted nucleic acid-binding protein